MHPSLAVAALRFTANENTANMIQAPPNIRDVALLQLVNDKGYPHDMMRSLTPETIRKLLFFLLRVNSKTVSFDPNLPTLEAYHGDDEQNDFLNKSLSIANRKGRFGFEADTVLESTRAIKDFARITNIQRTPIAIVGNGAAGIIAGRYLGGLGFSNVSVIDKRSVQAGIWLEKSVHEGTRNNPRNLDILGQRLSAAPGKGDEVLTVLKALADATHHRITDVVSRVIPGDLSHVIEMRSGDLYEFPIVINACGFGSPRPISDSARMIGPAQHVRAARWQNPSLRKISNKRKMFIFVGLGNSTAEMIQILQAQQDNGSDVDYRVLTHYPRDAVFNPYDTVHKSGISYRMFRDTTRPNLTSYQGDLEASHTAYYRALLGDKIIPDVREWAVGTDGDTTRRRIGVKTRNSSHNMADYVTTFDELYVLTGYQHTRESLTTMGLTCDRSGIYPRFDYDGEFMRDPRSREAQSRLYKGYFGFGSLLSTPISKNAMVIPGMLFRAPDLIFGVILRAIEYQFRQDNLLRSLQSRFTNIATESKVTGLDAKYANHRQLHITIEPKPNRRGGLGNLRQDRDTLG